jgi:hypothetical protein
MADTVFCKKCAVGKRLSYYMHFGLKKKAFLLLRTKLKQVFQVPMFLVQFSHLLLFFAIAIFIFFLSFLFSCGFRFHPASFLGFPRPVPTH